MTVCQGEDLNVRLLNLDTQTLPGPAWVAKLANRKEAKSLQTVNLERDRVETSFKTRTSLVEVSLQRVELHKAFSKHRDTQNIIDTHCLFAYRLLTREIVGVQNFGALNRWIW